MVRRPFVLLLLLALCVPAWSAEPLPTAPAGFKVEVVLQAPDIEAPTALCVAPNGDVYFAEDPMDMSGPPTKNLDRIWLLKDGDPQKKVLVADKLWAVMGLEVVRDKLYVVHAPHVTVFTLGADGTPTDRKDLFSDLGPPVAGLPGFNDHIPSGIRMGMDGWLYVSIGDKGIPRMTRKEENEGSTHVAEGRERRTPPSPPPGKGGTGGVISLEGGGVIHFRPDGSHLEVFTSGTRNHLDVPLDAQDRIFVRDNTDDGDGWNTRFMYVTNGGFYGYPWAFTRHPNEVLPMIHDFGGGSPCGGWVYEDDGLPETYRGRVFHCEWGKGRVFAVKTAADGAGFQLVDEIKFLDPSPPSPPPKGAAPAAVKDFRPFTLRPTADGRGFYVSDWGFSGWLTAKKAGHIYKVTYTGDDVKPEPRGHDTDSVEQLIQSLSHPAHSERLRAQRALVARGKEALEGLAKRLASGGLSARAKRHALWALTEGGYEGWVEVAEGLAQDTDATVRLQAARVLGTYRRSDFPHGLGKIPPPADVLLKLVEKDPDPQVRLHAASALARKCTPSDCKALVLDLEPEQDHWVRFAIVRTLKRSVDWKALNQLLGKEDVLKGKPRALEGLLWALTEEYDLSAVAILQRLAGDADASVRRRAIEVLTRVHHDRAPYAGTWWGTRPEHQNPRPRLVDWEGTPVVRDSLLHALSDREMEVRKAAVAGLLQMNDPSTLDALTAQFARESDPEMRGGIVRAVAVQKAPKVTDFLGAVTQDAKTPEPLRLEAIAGLERVNSPAAVTAVAGLVRGGESGAVQSRALEALGNMKAKAARPVVEASLTSPDAAVRRAAVGSLANLGDRAAGPLLLPLLQDKEVAVRTAAIQALGTLQAKTAIPELIKAAADEGTQFEAVTALTRMPDLRALTAYLTGLGSKNADLRKASREAIAAVREESLPILEQLVKRNEVPANVMPELRTIYATVVPIVSWRIIGPFPNDGKAYPPQAEQKFDAVYDGSDGKSVKWQKRQGNAKKHGYLDLRKLFTPNTDVVAYAHAEIESPSDRGALLLAGSDHALAIWLNGQKVHDFPGDRGWSYDADKVHVHLQKGKNQLLIKCGQHDGAWGFSVGLSSVAEEYAFLKGAVKKYDLEAYRAHARKHAGDPEHGRTLFMDLKGLACVKCHAVAGQGGQVGPDLAGIALKYKREDLMTAVLEPSKVIAQGYETIVITTTSGQVLTGVYKGESANTVNLSDAEGKRLSVPKKDIEERGYSGVSVMPNGLNEGMTLQDFADVMGFLEARREDPGQPGK